MLAMIMGVVGTKLFEGQCAKGPAITVGKLPLSSPSLSSSCSRLAGISVSSRGAGWSVCSDRCPSVDLFLNLIGHDRILHGKDDSGLAEGMPGAGGCSSQSGFA